MTNEEFMKEAVKDGWNYALILDFLDQLGHGRWQEIEEPTMEGLREYAADQQSSYDAQVRWDAGNRREPLVGKMVSATRSYYA